MTLNEYVTQKVTHELSTKIVGLLSSVSGDLSIEQINTLVDTKLSSRTMKISENNDIGLCISRLVDLCEAGAISATEDVASVYARMREDDHVVTPLIEKAANEVASVISTPLYELRKTIPDMARTMAQKIQEAIPEASSRDELPSPTMFDWGKLGLHHHRTAAIEFARDRIRCFKSDVPNVFDTDLILRSLPYETVTTVQQAPATKPVLMTVMTTALETAAIEDTERHTVSTYAALAADVLLSERAYRSWVISAVNNLQGRNLSEAIVAVTEQIDAIEDIARATTVTALSETTDISTEQAEVILKNASVVLSNTCLLRAAMAYHKDKTLADRLILSPLVVQKSAYESFLAEGGTPEMVVDYILYLKLNDNLKIPHNGVAQETVSNAHEKAHHAVKRNEAKLRDMFAATRAHMKQERMITTLNNHYQDGLRNNTYIVEEAEIHEHNRNRALALLIQKPVEDVAIEYLVGMRRSPLHDKLHTALQNEFVSLVNLQQDIQKKDVAIATCSAVLDVIYNSFEEKLAA